jgi:nitrogen fixation NifU-like protein
VSDLGDLYQEVLLDHYRAPRNRGRLAGANHRAEGYNPLCGDRITLYARVEGERAKEVTFEGSGCAISTAAASLMTEAVHGKTREEIEALFDRFHGLVTSDPAGEPPTEGLGKLAIFAGVREFPIRVKCATLAWHALRAALDGRQDPVSTEALED